MLFQIVFYSLLFQNVLSQHFLYKKDDFKQLFETFTTAFKKTYKNEAEKAERFTVFGENLKIINELNLRTGKDSYVINNHADMTSQEFHALHSNLRMDGNYRNVCKLIQDDDVITRDAPPSLDWRKLKKVTRVRNQNTEISVCGCCWAISTVENIEGQYAIKHNELVELSVEQLTACDARNGGCFGGFITTAMRSTIEMGGLQTEADYPFDPYNRYPICEYDRSKAKAVVTDCYRFDLKDPEVLKEVIYKYGPVSAAISVEGLMFVGPNHILDQKDCPSPYEVHAVLIIGYGTENGTDFWRLKNSWGTRWADEGFFRLKRGPGLNVCHMINDFMGSTVVA